MIAALGMYDSAASAPALDRLWAGLRDRLRGEGIAAPEALTRGEAAFWPAWQHPDLLLSQTCGFPYRAKLHGHVQLVAAPHCGLPETPPGYYHSVVVARADDPRQSLAAFAPSRLVWNEDLSHSGWAALANLARSEGLTLHPHHRSGGHRASARAVRHGLGDYAALDAITWAMMTEDDSGDATGLRIITRTPPTPALPFITGPKNDPKQIFSALAAAIDNLSQADRALLHLHGVVRLAAADYLAVPSPSAPVIL